MVILETTEPHLTEEELKAEENLDTEAAIQFQRECPDQMRALMKRGGEVVHPALPNRRDR